MATRSKDVAVAKSKPPAATTSSTPSGSTTTPAMTPPATATAASAATAAAASSGVATTTTSSSTTKTSRGTDRSKTNSTTATTTTSSTVIAASSSATTATGTTTSTETSSGTTAATSTAASAATTSTATTSTTAAPASSSVGPSTPLGSNKPQPPASTSSTSTENSPPRSQVDLSQCALCGGHASDSPEEMMLCLCCGCSFHARCANLPQTPEEGDIFCRWECFSTFRKNQGVAPKTPLGDFSMLAARVQTILGDHGGPPLPSQMTNAKRTKRASNGRSRSPSPYEASGHNGYGHVPEEVGPRRPSPSGRGPPRPRNTFAHVDLTLDEDELPLPRSPRTRPLRSGPGGRPPIDDVPFGDADELRSKRPKYALPPDDPMLSNGGRAGSVLSRRESFPQPSSRRTPSPSVNGYVDDIPSHFSGAMPPGIDGLKGGGPGFGPGPSFDHRGISPRSAGRASGPGSSRMVPPGDDEPMGSRPSSGRSLRPGSGNTRYSDRSDEFEGPRGPPRSRPSSAEQSERRSSGRGPPPDGPPGSARQPMQPMHPGMPPARYSIPWLNPAAFPASLRERFVCKPDNVNGVFRIDLSPVFADKSTHLYQSEIDFFFRCFESADVSLVVKGMASELNQYIWAWPFILESCGSETHFSFDHFQFRHNANNLPELEYVGELRLSMAAYNAYLERYLSGGRGNDVVVLEDHATKKPISLVASENIIALNNLVIAEHCAQLYNDLIKSFQWDVFAGGIHCLLQYLPQATRHKRFASPLLHFNFPGARGRLRDPGNGTTDTAYQVLTGSLELVIFERLEPKDRDTFLRVLHAAGYDASKKSMLLDSHLRVLRDAGFAWSTVLLSGGEFVHVNKGRLHFWRVVENETTRGPMVNAPCVFLSWEWVYQGVSQRGISTECWFAMKNASLCTGGWAFDPRRAIVEAAKCGVAIVRTGQFLNSLSGPGAPPVLRQLAFTGASPATIDRDVVSQRQEQMVLFLESILPCMDAIVEEEFELGLVKDDSDDFRKVFDDESMWKVVDTALAAKPRDAEYDCGICGLELTNIYKQCLGCTVHARRRRPNASYPIFRICLRCHAQPERHHFKPRVLRGFYDKLCSSEGHTGLLPATRRYQAERSYFKCRCAPYVRCADCGGCESCCCLCHTLFQTRFRFTAPEHLDHLRTDVVDVIKWHNQQQHQPHLQRPHPQR